MKSTKLGMIKRLSGLGVFLFGAVLTVIYGEPSSVAIGLAGMALIWVITLEEEVYAKK